MALYLDDRNASSGRPSTPSGGSKHAGSRLGPLLHAAQACLAHGLHPIRERRWGALSATDPVPEARSFRTLAAACRRLRLGGVDQLVVVG